MAPNNQRNLGQHGSTDRSTVIEHHKDKVTLKIQVKETRRKLCTLYLDENVTLLAVKDEIVRKNKSVIIKNLFIKEE